MQDIPYSAPADGAAGDTLRWYQRAPDNLSADGWSLAVYLSGEKQVTGTVTTVDGEFLVTFAATVTAALPAGIYNWVARATLSGITELVARGTISMAADPATLDGDSRSWDEQMLAAIQEVISGRLPADVDRYSVGSGTGIREMWKTQPGELRKWLTFYERRVLARRNGGRLPSLEVTFANA